jgi:hypothetical protein
MGIPDESDVAKMTNRLKADLSRYFVPAANPGAKLGDFRIGPHQSRARARAMVANFAEEQRKIEADEFGNLTPIEQATLEDVDDPRVRIWMVCLLCAAREPEKVYETVLHWPTPKEIWRNRTMIYEKRPYD